MNHTEVLNYLIEQRNLKRYLEIGVQNPWNNYQKIKAETKVGVDPDARMWEINRQTSDEYFKQFKEDKFDLIFIDGLHEYEQVKRDFYNALECLNDGGFIVLHDTNPPNEQCTLIPRVTKEWCGDVYRFASQLDTISTICFMTLVEDYGITVVWKQGSPTNTLTDIDWKYFNEYRKELLHIVTEERFKNDIIIIAAPVTTQS